jgi:hypothetical protein
MSPCSQPRDCPRNRACTDSLLGWACEALQNGAHHWLQIYLDLAKSPLLATTDSHAVSCTSHLRGCSSAIATLCHWCCAVRHGDAVAISAVAGCGRLLW